MWMITFFITQYVKLLCALKNLATMKNICEEVHFLVNLLVEGL